MQIIYDRDSDSKYVRLSPRSAKVARTEKISEWLIADYTRSGSLIGFEILDASKHSEKSVVILNNGIQIVKSAMYITRSKNSDVSSVLNLGNLGLSNNFTPVPAGI